MPPFYLHHENLISMIVKGKQHLDTISSGVSRCDTWNSSVQSDSDITDPDWPMHTTSGTTHSVSGNYGCWIVYIWIGSIPNIRSASENAVSRPTLRFSNCLCPPGNYNRAILLKPRIRGVPCIWTPSWEGCIVRFGVD